MSVVDLSKAGCSGMPTRPCPNIARTTSATNFSAFRCSRLQAPGLHRPRSLSCVCVSPRYFLAPGGLRSPLQPQRSRRSSNSIVKLWGGADGDQPIHNTLQKISFADKFKNFVRGAAASAGMPADGFFEQPKQFVVEGQTGWRRRWTIVLLCFVAFMLCNMDRVNMSVAILPMSQEFGWSSQTMGFVQSSFFWGYLMTQVLGGIWADRFGGKLVLGMGVVWWSLATAFTPIAAHMGLPYLLVARCLMGIGEGVAMPAMNTLLARWVPVKERSRSLALVYSGMFLGSIMGLGLSPHIIHALGWPSVFYMFGSLGIVWYFGWQRSACSCPSEDPAISPGEQKYIAANTATRSAKGAPIPWKKLLSRKEVWAIIVCHFCHNWGTFILLTWMPSYYNQVLGLDLMKSGMLSVLPWVTMAICSNIGGWIADTLVERGTSITAVRKIMQTIGFLGPAFFLTQLSGVSTATGAVLCMMAAQGCDAFSQSGLYSNHQDIAPRYAGVLLGMSNTAGVLAGVLGSIATGFILQHGSWDQVWNVAVALYLLGTVIWNLFATGDRIFE